MHSPLLSKDRANVEAGTCKVSFEMRLRFILVGFGVRPAVRAFHHTAPSSTRACNGITAAQKSHFGARRFSESNCKGGQSHRLCTRMAGVRAPACVGDALSSVETPVLLVDLDALEANVRVLKSTLGSHAERIALRPHAKAHKCSAIARLQVSMGGAVGVCCQKVSEAEAMVSGGVTNVHLSNEVVCPKKLLRLASLARAARVSICVDSVEGILRLEDACAVIGTRIAALVEIDVGQMRCGVEPGEPAVALARTIAACPHLCFAGLQAYHGSNQHIRTAAERAAVVDAVCGHVRATTVALASAGIECTFVTGGGTGSYLAEVASGLFSEIQPGSYVFMDADYARNKDASGQPFLQFAPSLSILATVMSRPVAARAVVDVGTKAHSMDSGPPEVLDLSGRAMDNVMYICGGDEHGILAKNGSGPSEWFDSLGVGDRVRLFPGHCDPTVNLYDWIVGVRGGIVESVWPIDGRGPGL